MKNWKTTAAGIVSGISSITAGVAIFLKGGDVTAALSAVIAGVGLIFVGVHAKDATAP